MKQRSAIKLGMKVICKIADSGTHTLVFETDQEAADFVKFVEGLNPNKQDDVDLFKDTVEAIITPVSSTELEAAKEAEEKRAKVDKLLTGDERFTTSNGQLYFRETNNLSIPEVVADELVAAFGNEKRFNALLNFWRLNALNPDPEAREGLYRFITDLNLSLTQEGMFVAYRNVVNKNNIDHKMLDKVSRLWLSASHDHEGTSTKLIQILSIEWPVDAFGDLVEEDDESFEEWVGEDFFIISDKEVVEPEDYEEESYTLPELLDKDVLEQIKAQIKAIDPDIKWKSFKKAAIINEITFLGNLQEVYVDMVKSVGKGLELTDAHTRSMSINVGVPVSMPRGECDSNPKVSCSRGLHVGSTNFMSQGIFGSLGLVVLVNPKDVVAVPYEYGTGYKMRCCKYLPIAIASYDEDGKLIEVQDNVLNINSSEFLKEEMELMKTLANRDYQDAVKHQYLPSHMNYIDTQALINSIRKNVIERTIHV